VLKKDRTSSLSWDSPSNVGGTCISLEGESTLFYGQQLKSYRPESIQMGGQLHIAPVAVRLAPRSFNGDPQSRIKHHHTEKTQKTGQPSSGKEGLLNKICLALEY